MVQNEITCSENSNCQNDVTKILQVSSRKSKIEKPPDHIVELPNYEEDQSAENNNEILKIHSLALLASDVESKALDKLNRKNSKTCQECIAALSENELQNDSLITFQSKTRNVKQPCVSTVKLLQHIDGMLKSLESMDVSFDSVVSYFFQNFYESSKFDAEHDHKYDFLELLIETYLHTRSTDIAKIFTRQNHDKLIRHDKLKEIHFSGQ